MALCHIGSQHNVVGHTVGEYVENNRGQVSGTTGPCHNFPKTSSTVHNALVHGRDSNQPVHGSCPGSQDKTNNAAAKEYYVGFNFSLWCI